MPNVTAEKAREIKQYVDYIKRSFLEGTYEDIRNNLPGGVNVSALPGIAEVRASFEQLLKELDGSDDGLVELSDASLPCLKRVMLTVRRKEASYVEQGKADARNPDVLRMLDEHLKPFDDFLKIDWLTKVTPMKMPRLIDYLSIQQVVEIYRRRGRLQSRPEGDPIDRKYDEKFGILQSPNQFFGDLQFHRQVCGLRGNGVIVAFIDIDDFKKVNEHLGAEARVDQLVLPRLMEAIESHVFTHGHAYRYGGDEYVLLLPNMDASLGGFFLEQLRQKVEALSYPGTGVRTTVSVGFIFVEADSFLTEWDVLERANRAKTYAKTGGGKNCIATYRGPLFDESELHTVRT